MAASLGSIAETWPENVLTSIVSRKSHCVRKIIARPIFFILFQNYFGAGRIFCAFAQFSAGIGPAHFPAAFRMLLSQHSKEGAPFLGTALAEDKQCIGPRSSAIFTEIRKIILKFVIRNQELSTVTVLNLSSKWQSSGFSSFILLNISVCGIFRASRISL